MHMFVSQRKSIENFRNGHKSFIHLNWSQKLIITKTQLPMISQKWPKVINEHDFLRSHMLLSFETVLNYIDLNFYNYLPQSFTRVKNNNLKHSNKIQSMLIIRLLKTSSISYDIFNERNERFNFSLMKKIGMCFFTTLNF